MDIKSKYEEQEKLLNQIVEILKDKSFDPEDPYLKGKDRNAYILACIEDI